MDPIFNLFKVKFSLLDEMIDKNGPSFNRGDKVNVYINLEMVIRKLRAQNVDDYLKVRKEEKVYEMISNIINLVSHYRLYFAKNKIYSHIYLYMNFPFDVQYKNRAILPDYRKHYQHRYTDDNRSKTLAKTLDVVIPFTKTILDYVEDVHFINSDMLESSLVPLIVSEDKPMQHNFIVTTDKYDYQYALKDFYIIRPKQSSSYLVNKTNLMSIVKMEEKTMSKINVPATFYPFILSLLGDKERNIDKIKGVGLSSILTMIDKGIKENLISSELTNINLLMKVIREEYRDLLLANYYCIDLTTQNRLFNSRDNFSIKDQIVNKFDNVSLKTINAKYFSEHPIQLLELTSASKLLVKKKRDIFLQGGNMNGGSKKGT